MPGYVLYGFDTAGTLAEETLDPRRRAPWAILQAILAAGLAGGLLIIAGLLAASDPTLPELGELTGGLPLIVKQSLGASLGNLFLGVVVFAVTVCALAVQASAVRLIFAMARDNALPCADPLLGSGTDPHSDRPGPGHGYRGGDDPADQRKRAENHGNPLFSGNRLGELGVSDGVVAATADEAAGLAARADRRRKDTCWRRP